MKRYFFFLTLLLICLDGNAQIGFGNDFSCSPGVYDSRFTALDAQKRAVFKYRTSVNGPSCTGCLINQKVNGIPKQFFLTARHCIYGGDYGEGDLVNLNNFQFFFNFQSPNGDNGSVPQASPFLQGNRGENYNNLRYGFESSVSLVYVSTVFRVGPLVPGIDMALLEINQPIPPHFNVHYAGWKSDALLGTNGILNAPMRMFHHPSGDTKKYGETLQVTKTDLPTATVCRVVTKVFDAIIRFFGGKSVTEVVCDLVDVPQYEIPLLTHGATRGGTSGSPWFTSAGRIFGVLSAELTNRECVNIGAITAGKFRNAYAHRNLREALNPNYEVGPNLFGIDGRDIGCYTDNPLRLSGDYFPANQYQPNNLIIISAQNDIEAGRTDSDSRNGITGYIDYAGVNNAAVQANPFGVEERRLRIYAGADFEFRAGGVIRLLDGFVVENGASFRARPGQACNGARVGVDESATNQTPGSVGPTLNVTTDEPADLVVSPNPSTGAVRCQYLVRQTGAVKLVVIDTQGHELLTGLDVSNQQPGRYEITQDLSALPPGVYLMQLQTATGKTTERVVLQR
jgi:Secretion system C-terminal sorting domain